MPRENKKITKFEETWVYVFEIPKEKFGEITAGIKGQQFCKPDKDDPFYPKPNAKILGTEFVKVSQEQLEKF